MENYQYQMKHEAEEDSVLERPRVSLLDEKHWRYIQKRYHISCRETQIAKLICQGFSNDEIARYLKIKIGTVKTHIRNIYRRIRVNNKIEMLLKFVDVSTRFFAKSESVPVIYLDKKQESKADTSLDMP